MYLNKINKTKQLICSIILATGGVIWFGNTTLGVYKTIMSIILLILCANYIAKPITNVTKYLLLLITLSIISTAITLKPNSDYNWFFVWGLFENIFFLLIGYHFAKDDFISDKFIYTIIFIIGIISLLTITNYFFNIPDWVSPIEKLRIERLFTEHNISNIEENRLHSTGFGIGRTGWASTLALFIPLCFVCIKHNYKPLKVKILMGIILASIFISGSRGGLLSCAIIIIMYLIQTLTEKITYGKITLLFLLIPIIGFILIIHESFFIEHLRLDVSDLTTGRGNQYELIPSMIDSMGFWGLGENGTRFFLNKYGIEHELHNAYFRNFIDYGWLVGILIFLYTYSLVKIVFKSYRNGKTSFEKIIPLIILSGLVSACFEPGAIFASRMWYITWWFFLGVLLYCRDTKHLCKTS